MTASGRSMYPNVVVAASRSSSSQSSDDDQPASKPPASTSRSRRMVSEGRPAALMLCGVMTVAIVTAAAPEKHITANWHGLLEFFYLPEVLLFLLFAWLIFAGPGRASLDVRFDARR